MDNVLHCLRIKIANIILPGIVLNLVKKTLFNNIPEKTSVKAGP
jgi:hypothetical protein